jgi:hypothetical protein
VQDRAGTEPDELSALKIEGVHAGLEGETAPGFREGKRNRQAEAQRQFRQRQKATPPPPSPLVPARRALALAIGAAPLACLADRPWPRGEKDTKPAQKLGQLQPLIAVSPRECMGRLASFGPA